MAALLWASVALAGPAVAGKLDLSQVPASALWVAHANIEDGLDSKVGAFVLEQLEDPAHQACLTVFKNMSGLDVTKDIRDVVLYGMGPGDEDGVALFEGTFDQEKLLALLKTNPTVEQMALGDLTVYQWTDKPKARKPGPARFGTFYRADLIIIAGRRDWLEQAVAVLEKEAESLAEDPSRLKIEPSDGAYLGAYVAELPKPARKGKAALLEKFTSARLEIGEKGGLCFLELAAVAKDQQSAVQLAAMAEGFLAFLNLTRHVEENGKDVIPAELAAILEDVHIATQDTVVKVSLETPARNVIALLEWMAAQKKAEKPNRRRGSCGR